MRGYAQQPLQPSEDAYVVGQLAGARLDLGDSPFGEARHVGKLARAQPVGLAGYGDDGSWVVVLDRLTYLPRPPGLGEQRAKSGAGRYADVPPAHRQRCHGRLAGQLSPALCDRWRPGPKGGSLAQSSWRVDRLARCDHQPSNIAVVGQLVPR